MKKWIIGIVGTVCISGLLISCIYLWKQVKKREEEIAGLMVQITELGPVNYEVGQSKAVAVGESFEEQDTQQADIVSEEAKYEGYRKVYLTFDDGPSSNTSEILDILKKYDVKATFFLTGKDRKEYDEIYKRIAGEGHTVGLHTYSHEYSSIYASVDSFWEDLSKLQDFLYAKTGVWSGYYRFPGGSSNTISRADIHELISFIREQGIQYYDWNVAIGDASGMPVSREQIWENVRKQSEGYDTICILMHDATGKKSTIEALPGMIEYFLAREDTVILPITMDTKAVHHVKE